LNNPRPIRPLDDLAVWNIICVIIRGGHRRHGYPTPLTNGAVERRVARRARRRELSGGPGSGRIDLTVVFVGTRVTSRAYQRDDKDLDTADGRPSLAGVGLLGRSSNTCAHRGPLSFTNGSDVPGSKPPANVPTQPRTAFREGRRESRVGPATAGNPFGSRSR
jgi:hypothetical protein